MKGKCHLLHLSWMEKHKGSREGNMKTTEGDVRQIDNKIDSRRLINDIRQPLIPFEIEDYSILVERDKRGGLPLFPYDFPDSSAYSSLVTAEATKADEDAKLRPPSFRPISVPIATQCHCVAHTLHKGFYINESYYVSIEIDHVTSFNMYSQDKKQSPYEHARKYFDVSILRISYDLNYTLEKINGEGYLDQVGGPLFNIHHHRCHSRSSNLISQDKIFIVGSYMCRRIAKGCQIGFQVGTGKSSSGRERCG
ncbi:hypothetical protein IEQ34_005442 [Dendrobium chrysotoxum]|uniref:Uncharacterized protein n=1 Tax=Dendrobium chrysotoxum TaxID=161865 RepID=A0AAV7HB57_DENCH|nr:hypothetical protein IEQ34_005442 [Dendrobium chrysotoxum]